MAKVDTFSSWLLTKLNVLNVDENIFLNYVLSILEGEETRDEKLDILKSVLGDSLSSEEEANVHCVEILDKWQQSLVNVTEQEPTEKIVEDVDQKLARLLEANVRLEETTHTCKYTDEELKIRAAILSKYSHADDSEDEFEEGEADNLSDLERNTNASSIHQAEKEKREKAKLENQKKKERDKLEREKQKLSQQEKKEARKKRAQKVEHHRK